MPSSIRSSVGCSQHDRRDRGQATLELALILPAVVLVVAGVVWVSNLMLTQVQAENIAREGARAAAVDPLRAQSAATEAASGSPFTVRAVVGSTSVEVTASAEIGGVPLLGVGAREVSASVVMRREDKILP